MSDEVVIVANPTETSTQTETSEAASVAASEAIVAASETNSEAATDIAEIQASRDISVAEIAASVERDRIAAAERATANQEELTQCRANIETLSVTVAGLVEQIQSIQTRLTEAPPPMSPADSVKGAETPASQEAPEQVPRKKKAHRWI